MCLFFFLLKGQRIIFCAKIRSLKNHLQIASVRQGCPPCTACRNTVYGRTDGWTDRLSVAVYTVLKSMSSPVCCHGPSRAKTVFKHYLNIHINSVKLLIPVSRIGDGHRHTITAKAFSFNDFFLNHVIEFLHDFKMA